MSSPSLGFKAFPALVDVENRLLKEDAGLGQGRNVTRTSLWAPWKEIPDA